MNDFLKQVESFIMDSHNDLIKYSNGEDMPKLSKPEKDGSKIFRDWMLRQLTEAKKLYKEQK